MGGLTPCCSLSGKQIHEPWSEKIKDSNRNYIKSKGYLKLVLSSNYSCRAVKMRDYTQHSVKCCVHCIKPPVQFAFTVWLMKSFPRMIDFQIFESSPSHQAHLGFPLDAGTENTPPKVAGRPKRLQLMIWAKYLMLACWSSDIQDAQLWIMDPFGDLGITELSKVLNESQVIF